MGPAEEIAAVIRVLKGERDAYALLVDAYRTQIFNLAYRMTGSYDEAADLAQESFIQAYLNLGKFRQDKRFFTWLYSIALNLLRNHLKKRKQERRLSDTRGAQERYASEETPEKILLDDERTQKLVAALQILPLEQREALVLRFYQGLSFDEIGAATRLSLSAVKMRVYRGLENLKRSMARGDSGKCSHGLRVL